MTASEQVPLPSAADMSAMFEQLKNWGRWGADDEQGTLSLIGDAQRVGAAGLVTSGVAVSLSQNITTDPTPETPNPAQHQMLACGSDIHSSGIPGFEATRDSFTIDVHGVGITHLDALCHMFVNGQMFNGFGPETVTSTGAEHCSVMTAADGIVGRGVLLDVPAALGIEFLEPGNRVTVANLECAEERQDVRIGLGDLLVVSTGRDVRTRHLGGTLDPFTDGLAGLHPECLPWLHERDVSLVGSDGISDPMPASPIERWPFPIHQVGMVSIGLMLVDNMRLDDLIARCALEERWEFMLQIAPLRLPGATGCPVNPVALF